MAKIGILGGTFAPPHIGHLILADTVLTALQLDRVVFIPVGQPTHKTTMIAADQRLAMCQLAIMGDERLAVDDLDIERPPPHYTVDLIPQLKEKWSGDTLMLILGGDSIADLPDWHQPERLLQSIAVVGLDRPGFTIDWAALDHLHPQIDSRITMVDGPSVHVSSTVLRRSIARGMAPRYLIPAAVRDYIAQENLFVAHHEGEH